MSKCFLNRFDYSFKSYDAETKMVHAIADTLLVKNNKYKAQNDGNSDRFEKRKANRRVF